jgi:hypothetical protein
VASVGRAPGRRRAVHFRRARVSVDWGGREMGRRKVGGHDYALVVTAVGTRYRLCLPIEASHGRFSERPSGRETRGLAADEGGDSLLCPSIVGFHRCAITSSLGMLTKWRQSTERPGTAARYPRATSRGRRVRPGQTARNGTVNLTDKEGARLVARHDVLRGGAPARGAACFMGTASSTGLGLAETAGFARPGGGLGPRVCWLRSGTSLAP